MAGSKAFGVIRYGGGADGIGTVSGIVKRRDRGEGFLEQSVKFTVWRGDSDPSAVRFTASYGSGAFTSIDHFRT